ncbi:MAG: hypothetical protein NC307_10430 [Roseburia sp.]|nr:hypothetical protein [Roseburia sp.]
MGKNARLADIYIKIYNKKPLMWEDMKFLAVYDPECFEKTCKNLIFNIPETEKLMQPETEQEEMMENISRMSEVLPALPKNPVLSDRDRIAILLENLKKMEKDEFGVQEVSVEKVKNLLGNLYMEMLFPHNDREKYFQFENHDSSIFNKKA